MRINENDSILESYFVFHYSSNQYLLSVHYVYDNILDSREVNKYRLYDHCSWRAYNLKRKHKTNFNKQSFNVKSAKQGVGNNTHSLFKQNFENS